MKIEEEPISDDESTDSEGSGLRIEEAGDNEEVGDEDEVGDNEEGVEHVQKKKAPRALRELADAWNTEAKEEVDRIENDEARIMQDKLIEEQLNWIEGRSPKEFGMKVSEQIEEEESKVRSNDHILDYLEKLIRNKVKMNERERTIEIKRIIQNLKNEKPETFEEAYYHPDLKFRLRWRIAIKKEFRDMNSRKVWEMMTKKDIPENRKCIKCKWVFDVK